MSCNFFSYINLYLLINIILFVFLYIYAFAAHIWLECRRWIRININWNLFVDETFTVYQKGNLLKSLHMVCKNNGTWNVSCVYYVCNLPHEGNGRHISFQWHTFIENMTWTGIRGSNVFYRPIFVYSCIYYDISWKQCFIP